MLLMCNLSHALVVNRLAKDARSIPDSAVAVIESEKWNLVHHATTHAAE
jgi:hypothetical protein